MIVCLFCFDKSFKRDIIVLISFPILFVSTSFLVNIGKEMSLPGSVHLTCMLWFDNLSNSYGLFVEYPEI